MQYLLHKVFLKKIEKLPPKIREQFFERVRIFHRDTFDIILQNHSVDRAYPDCRSINVSGDYGAIYYINHNIAIFIDIGTHSELY